MTGTGGGGGGEAGGLGGGTAGQSSRQADGYDGSLKQSHRAMLHVSYNAKHV